VVFAKSIGSLVTDATRSLISHVARSVTFAIDAVGVQLCKFVLIAPKKGGRWAIEIVHFPIKNALDCRILHIKSQKFSGGNTPGPPQREGATPSRTHPQHGLRPCAGSAPGAWTQMPAFPLFLFYETTTGIGGGSFTRYNYDIIISVSLDIPLHNGVWLSML